MCIGVWSTLNARVVAPIRPAMNCCVSGLIMRSSCATKYHEGFFFHAGAGALS